MPNCYSAVNTRTYRGTYHNSFASTAYASVSVSLPPLPPVVSSHRSALQIFPHDREIKMVISISQNDINMINFFLGTIRICGRPSRWPNAPDVVTARNHRDSDFRTQTAAPLQRSLFELEKLLPECCI